MNSSYKDLINRIDEKLLERSIKINRSRKLTRPTLEMMALAASDLDLDDEQPREILNKEKERGRQSEEIKAEDNDDAENNYEDNEVP